MTIKRIILLTAFILLGLVSFADDCLPVVGLGDVIGLCQGQSVKLNAQNQGASYQWSTGASSQEIQVSSSGIYWVTVTNACGSASDTVEVVVITPIPHHGTKVLICANGTATHTLMSGPGFSYLWLNGPWGSAQTVTFNQPGTYLARINTPCGFVFDTVEVKETTFPLFSLGPDTQVCANMGFALSVGNVEGSVSWSTGQSSNSIVVFSSGTYTATVSNPCGTHTSSVHVTLLPFANFILPKVVNLCMGDFATLQALNTVPPGTSILWSTNQTSNTIQVSQPGIYHVSIQAPCGTFSDSVRVVGHTPLNINLGPDIDSCDRQPVLISGVPHGTGVSIQWSNGDTNTTTSIEFTGYYWVTVSNACGTFSDTIYAHLPKSPEPVLGDTSYLCLPDTLTLDATHSDSTTTYLWNTSETTAQIQVLTPGLYYVRIANRCDTLWDSVRVVTVPEIMPFQFPADTTLCSGNTLELSWPDSLPKGVEFVWNVWPTNSTPTHTVTSPGSYTLYVSNQCYSESATINVNYITTPTSHMGFSHYVCINNPVWPMLDAGNAGSTYHWNTGDTTQTINPQAPGTYYVHIQNQCGALYDTVKIVMEQPLAQMNLIQEDTLLTCSFPFNIQALHIPGVRYQWSTGHITRTGIANMPGNIWLMAFNSCDTLYDTVHVKLVNPPLLNLGSLVTLCSGNTLILNAQNPYSSYLWNTGDTTHYLFADTAGIYWVHVSNMCGEAWDTVEVVIEFPLQLKLPPDTAICLGDSLVINMDSVGSPHYLWNTGHTGPQLVIKNTGLYSLEVWNSCGKLKDSIYVLVKGIPEFDLGGPYGICHEEGLYIATGPAGMESYLWSNGDTLQSTQFYHAGTEWLFVNNGCFDYTDTLILIEEYPLELDLGPDTTLCISDELILNPGSVNVDVHWNTGFIGPQLQVFQTGWYVAQAQNSCGVFADSIYVIFQEPLREQLMDTLICLFDSAVVDIPLDLGWAVWYDGDTSNLRYFDEEGIYEYWLYNTCGGVPSKAKVEVANCWCPFYVPNSFTPNGDGINDAFAPGHDCPFESYLMQIYNRWGQMVFESRNPNIHWDGTYQGSPVPMGVYLYRLHYSWNAYEKTYERRKNGEVYLYR